MSLNIFFCNLFFIPCFPSLFSLKKNMFRLATTKAPLANVTKKDETKLNTKSINTNYLLQIAARQAAVKTVRAPVANAFYRFYSTGKI